MKMKVFFVTCVLMVTAPSYLSLCFGQSAPSISYHIPAEIIAGQPLSYSPTNTGGAVYSNGYIKTVAGNQTGPGGQTQGYAPDMAFGFISAMVYDPSGSLYFYDDGTKTIKKMTPSGHVTFIAGSGTSGVTNGIGAAASFRYPVGMVMDSQGYIYFCEKEDHIIRRIAPNGAVITLAGLSGVGGYADGSGGAARFNWPCGTAIDQDDNLYVMDGANHRIRKVTRLGVVSTLAGNANPGTVDGQGASARFNFSDISEYGNRIDTDSDGNIYVTHNNVIRKITPSGYVSTYIGIAGIASTQDGIGIAARLNGPKGLSIDKETNDIYLIQQDARIRKVTSSPEAITLSKGGYGYTGDGGAFDVSFSYPIGVLWGNDGGLLVTDESGHLGYLRKYENKSYAVTPVLPAGLNIDANGVISGTPFGLVPVRNYEVTAYNHIGQNTTTVSFSVVDSVLYRPNGARNYIIETTVRDSGITSISQLTGQPVTKVNRNIQYYDGFGRLIQTIQWQGSPKYKDIVQYHEYDNFGRVAFEYLPYAETLGNGNYNENAKTALANFYNSYNSWDPHVAKTPYPYSRTIFEKSPLNRELEKGAPGGVWQPLETVGTGHTVSQQYATNKTNEVKKWTVNTATNLVSGNGHYLSGELTKTTVRDENVPNAQQAGSYEEYKDIEGRIILKKIYDNTTPLNTYYVYDNLKRLRFVIPPNVTVTSFFENFSDTTFLYHVYSYKYDELGRLIEKRMPGKGLEEYIYNKNDKLVLTRDANLRQQKKWNYLKYDALGRIASKGIYTNTIDTLYNSVRALVENVSPLWEDRPKGTAEYSNLAFPNTANQMLELFVNYYDDYTFQNANLSTLQPSNIIKSEFTNSLQTGYLRRTTDGSLPMLTVQYYDDRGRIAQVVAQNHIGGVDVMTNTYNFSGELLSSTQEFKPSDGTTTTIFTTNTYDHAGRLSLVRKKINNQNEIIQSSLVYNEIGQLKSKKLHSENETDFLTTINYGYNERGWTKSITSPLYNQVLKYDSTSLQGAIPQYNGNISEQHWRFSHTDPMKDIVYKYDDLNRITSAITSGTSMNEIIEYDNTGNIQELTRDGIAIKYSYKNNKLKSLSGGITANFLYDANGNATKDRTGMVITYNHLNLPQAIIGSDRRVDYTYSSEGIKLQKKTSAGSNIEFRDYVAEIEYVKLGNNGLREIDRIGTEEGYLLKDGSTYKYYYYLEDHLGNVRTVIRRGTSAMQPEIMQQQDYYAFGKKKGILTSDENNYLYNGKEMQKEMAIGQHSFGGQYSWDGEYDYGARFYDPEIGRWNTVDPQAENYKMYSPYTYSGNNPIKYIDPDGEDFLIYYNNNQSVFRFNGKNYNDAPNDAFVQEFILMYRHLEKIGAGENTVAIARSPNYQIKVKFAGNADNIGFNRENNTIYWNPTLAGRTHNDKMLYSPINFEHEARHAKGYNDDKKAYIERYDHSPHPNYQNMEEFQTITGAERKTAFANGDIKKDEQTRLYYVNSIKEWNKTISSISKTPAFDFKQFLNDIKNAPDRNTRGPFIFSTDFWNNYHNNLKR
ncbi:DUF6443 domain-containing protein [Sphingobacterium haloxyli]|nr:DUF6443 domain-containing protein [Sphingobacterium haloxyli]